MLPERDVNTLQRSLINSPEHQTQQPTRRPVTHGALLGAGGRVAIAVSGALATVAVARILGPDGAGSYSVALNLLLILLAFTALGVEHGVVYYVSYRGVPAGKFSR